MFSAGKDLVEPLTDQERSILRLMAAGLSHSEISDELYLAEVAVDFGPTGLWVWKAGVWSQRSGADGDFILAGRILGLPGQQLYDKTRQILKKHE